MGGRESSQSRPPKYAKHRPEAPGSERARGLSNGPQGHRGVYARSPSTTESRRRVSGRELGSPAKSPLAPAAARAAGVGCGVASWGSPPASGRPLLPALSVAAWRLYSSTTPGQEWCPQSSSCPAAWAYHPAGTRQVDPIGHTLLPAPDPLGGPPASAGERLCARASARALSYLPQEVTIRTHPGR